MTVRFTLARRPGRHGRIHRGRMADAIRRTFDVGLRRLFDGHAPITCNPLASHSGNR